jgi:hypothetical protein
MANPGLSEEQKREISECIQSSIKSCLEDCETKCGINPRVHYADHQRIHSFFAMLDDTASTFRRMALRVIFGVLLLATILGLAFNYKDIIKHIRP